MAALKWLVGIMGVLIVVGTLALALVIVQRVGAAGEAEIGLRGLGQPGGTRIVSIASAEGRIAVLVQRPDGERVLLVDPKRGRVVGELRAGE